VAEFDIIASDDRPGSSIELGLTGDTALGFPGIDPFGSRCAGPTVADVRDVLPRRTISERALRRGHMRVDYSADGPFSAGGLAGTVHSDLVLHLGRTQDLLRQESPVQGPTRKEHLRTIDVTYRIERVSGQVVTEVRGLADPDLCGPLDACGLMGTVTTAPSASSGTVDVSALASASTSRAELRRAVGLKSGRRPRGVERYGIGFWEHDAGTTTAALARDGDAEAGCSDAEPLGSYGAFVLSFHGGRVEARYGDGLNSSIEDPLRGRCPGPTLTDVTGSGALATGTVPLRDLGRRHLTLRLRTGRSYSTDGYSGVTRPDVTIVLRRVRVHEYTQSFDVPEDFPEGLARADTIGRRDRPGYRYGW
jgi:hypothetical protein